MQNKTTTRIYWFKITPEDPSTLGWVDGKKATLPGHATKPDLLWDPQGPFLEDSLSVEMGSEVQRRWLIFGKKKEEEKGGIAKYEVLVKEAAEDEMIR